MQNSCDTLECEKIDENDLMPFATIESSDSFFSLITPEAKAVADSLKLPEYVEVKDFSTVAKQTVLAISFGHRLLDLVKEEKEHREKVKNEEDGIRYLLNDVVVSYKELQLLWEEYWSNQTNCMAEVLRQFYKKAVSGEFVFQQLRAKQKIISKEKLATIEEEMGFFSEAEKEKRRIV